MALTLSPELLAAQDSMERQPLIQMESTRIEESMPFDGAFLNSIPDNEYKTSLITATSGQIMGIYARQRSSVTDDVVFIYTDLDRLTWTEVFISVGRKIQGISIVELTNGNIGVIFTTHDTDIDINSISYMIISSTGDIVTAPTTTVAFANSFYPYDPSVIMLQDGSFLLSYTLENTTDSEDIRWSLQTRTSPTFSSWSSPSTISLLPLLDTRAIHNTSILKVEDGDILLLFDYVDFAKEDEIVVVTNIYKVLSTDNGVSWDTPEQLTSYTEWGTSANQPYIAERPDGNLSLAYTDFKAVLFGNDDTMPLWQTDCSGLGSTNATDMHLDSSTGLLYVLQILSTAGIKSLCGVVVVDINTWTVVRNYNTQTSPSYNTIFKDYHIWGHRHHGDESIVAFSSMDNLITCVIDDEIESLIQYAFKAYPSYEISQNVDITWPIVSDYLDFEDNADICATWVDAVSRRVYVVFSQPSYFMHTVLVGYIDMDDTIEASTGKYPWHEIMYSSSLFTDRQLVGMNGMCLIKERGQIALLGQSDFIGNPGYPGKLAIIDIDSGSIVKTYTTSSHQNFPWGGITDAVYYEGHLYGSFDYTTYDDQDNRRGMCDINIDTDTIVYHQPTWATINDYSLSAKVATGDGRILVAARSWGVGVFHTVNGAWELYDDDSVQGFSPGDDDIYSVAYDAVNQQVICGSIYKVGGFEGIRMFNESGSYNKGQLMTGVDSGGWVWGNLEDLTIGHLEADMAITYDPDNVLWAIWSHSDYTEQSIQWDRDVRSMVLTEFLVTAVPVSVDWSVENTGKLQFTVSDGHLFDPNNSLSVNNTFLKKGRQIDLKFGELIDGIEYWQDQGIYVVEGLKLKYQRGEYPTMNVTCESPDVIWGDVLIPATERYDTDDPEGMVADLVTDSVGMVAGNIIIPTFPNRHEIHHQWLGMNFQSLITEILDHFQHIPYFDMTGKFAPKRIRVDGSVDNIYTGAEIINFTPDDNFSSYTNRLIITGEGLYFMEVTYPEELMGTISGTGGWWENSSKTERVPYSNDLDVVCYDPRLVVLTSIKDFKILWRESGGDEYIGFVDPENRYVDIVIEFPGLMDMLIAAIVLMLAIGTMAASCIADCGAYIFAYSLVSSGVSWMLGQVASYQYEIYAKPTGEEKQLVSSQVDDTAFQRELGGLVVTEEFEDPYCYTVQSCKEVAEHELSIVKAQRSRVSFEKIAHLQDEICDNIQILHPYSQAPLNIFITNLRRTFTRPAKGAPGSGGLIDNITGWNL